MVWFLMGRTRQSERPYTLSCNGCTVELSIQHDPAEPFPKHRCRDGRVREFSDALEGKEPAKTVGRTDDFTHGPHARSLG